MIKRLDNVKLHISESEDMLLKIAQKTLKNRVKHFKILKKSLDARNKDDVFWVYSIVFSDEEQTEIKEFERLENPPKVAIIGSGPAGLFCALRLVERGFAPIIVERGEKVEKRRETIRDFFENARLDVNSNVQFGEGGAGAFSDGKLNTQTHDGYNKDVLKLFARFGAPEEILYLNKPHVGSDKLFFVLQKIRKYIENRGGKYLFNTVFSGFKAENGHLEGIYIKNAVSGEEDFLKTEYVVAALGHSSRDTFYMLDKGGVKMVPREFAVGVRIEHLSSEISAAQYGKFARMLPAADYKIVSHAHERTVFTFCMCPGGIVIPSSSEAGGVVTNGMSLYARDGVNSNSALMVQMKAEDYGEELFSGMEFQRSIERKAFALSGSYKAPVQLFGDFAADRVSCKFGSVKPTYAAGTVFAPLCEALPPVVIGALKAAVPDMNSKLNGFSTPDAVLTGVESRFSSPIRILRDENCESVSLKGLYPCGEGSGYSGGITSSAADGLKVADKIYLKINGNQ